MYFWVYVFKMIYLYWTLLWYLGFIKFFWQRFLLFKGCELSNCLLIEPDFFNRISIFAFSIRASQKMRIIHSSITTGIFVNYLPCKCRFSNHLDAFNVSLKIQYLLFFIKCLDNILKIKMYFHVLVHYKHVVIEFLWTMSLDQLWVICFFHFF